MARYLISATTLLPLVVLVATFGVCHAAVRSGVDLKEFLKNQVPSQAVTGHQLNTIPEMTFDIPGLTKDLIDEYEGHRSHNDEMQKYRDEHFSEYKEKRPVSEGTFSCYSAEEEAKMKADVAAAHKVYEDTVAEYAANNMTLPANITEPKLFDDEDCSTTKKFFIEPNGHRLNLSDWKDDMYFEQTYVDLVAVAQAEQTHWEAAQRDAQATVAKCIENPMFADRCKEYTTDAIMENSKNASAAQVQHFLEWQQKVKETDKQNTRTEAQLGLGYGNYHKMPGAAGAYRTGVVKEFKVVGMDRITDFIHRLSIINREILYYLGTGDTSWQTLRGKFEELKSLNQEAIASSKYSYGKEKDYFLLAFSLANIPITIINLLLHFVVRRQLNKYSL